MPRTRLRQTGGGDARLLIRMNFRGRVTASVRRWLAFRVAELLAARREAYAQASTDARTLSVRISALSASIDAALARYAPLDGALTVHAAHTRHPGVRALFARRGLPHCPDCAVGADETLSEAAFGEDFDLNGLIAEIRALEGL